MFDLVANRSQDSAQKYIITFLAQNYKFNLFLNDHPFFYYLNLNLSKIL